MLVYSDEYVQQMLRDAEDALKNAAFVKSSALAPYYANVKLPDITEED